MHPAVDADASSPSSKLQEGGTRSQGWISSTGAQEGGSRGTHPCANGLGTLSSSWSHVCHGQVAEDEVSDNSAECVVCLSDVRDTLILPCRHLCLCNTCADTLRYQANNCPICRLRKHGLPALGRGWDRWEWAGISHAGAGMSGNGLASLGFHWHLPSWGSGSAPCAAMLCSAGRTLLGNGCYSGSCLIQYQFSPNLLSPLPQLSEPCFKSEP